MRFGLSFLPDATPSSKSPSAYFSDALELSEIADQAGLYMVKMTEHHLHPYGGYCPSPFSFLSAAAARTRRIRLLTGAVLPTFHHPIQIAAEAGMLDALSGGRAEIGFGRAYLPYEFEAFGVPVDESRERFVETVNAVIRLWLESAVTIETRFFAFRNARVLPPCTQKPHPPVWIAAVQSRQSFAWIGQEGFKLLISSGLSDRSFLRDLISIYRESFSENHPDVDKLPEVAISLPLYIRDTEESACTEGDLYLRRYLDVWADAAKAWDTSTSPAYPGYAGMGRFLRGDSPQAMRQRGAAVVGSPEHVIEQIHQLVEDLGIDYILWQIDFGAMPGEDARRTLTSFIELRCDAAASCPSRLR